MKVGIVANLDKKDARQVTLKLIDWLRSRGAVPLLAGATAEGLGRPEMGDEQGLAGVDFIVVLGGDGTLLKAARQTAALGRPLLGVNLGHLGFLTEIEGAHLLEDLEGFLDGRYEIEERSMLQARVFPLPKGGSTTADRKVRHESLALNDVVITKGTFARMVQLETFIDGNEVTTYPADGLIIATPTGSTAYSLSAGGPLVNPNLDVLIITPICPHTFYSRPLIISKNERITIRTRPPEGQQTTLTVDGQVGYMLDSLQEEVEIALAEPVVRLMRRPGWNFYEVLRRKLKEGDGTSP